MDTGDNDGLTEKIIGFAIEVHRFLGPGLLESVYEECLCLELNRAKVTFKRQVPLAVTYKGLRLNCGYRLDLVVADRVVVEVKAIESLLPVHKAQLYETRPYSCRSVAEFSLLGVERWHPAPSAWHDVFWLVVTSRLCARPLTMSQ